MYQQIYDCKYTGGIYKLVKYLYKSISADKLMLSKLAINWFHCVMINVCISQSDSQSTIIWALIFLDLLVSNVPHKYWESLLWPNRLLRFWDFFIIAFLWASSNLLACRSRSRSNGLRSFGLLPSSFYMYTDTHWVTKNLNFAKFWLCILVSRLLSTNERKSEQVHIPPLQHYLAVQYIMMNGRVWVCIHYEK